MNSLTETHTADRLIKHSVDVIQRGQHAAGGYIASPNFSQYRFGWLRDGSYVALSMDARGHGDSAERFHRWITEVVLAHADDVHAVIEARREGEEPDRSMLLPTRYTLEGEREDEAHEAWPNFQLDGYGTWLFSLASHLNEPLSGDTAEKYREAVTLVGDYLSACWDMPCYDYWEEFGDRVHTSTLAAIAAGLRAAGMLLKSEKYTERADVVLAYMLENCVVDGSFVKGPEDGRVDSSLVSIAVPFGLVSVTDRVMARTAERIRTELSAPEGGIRRYVGDTYYGGNPWVLLTAWLGWFDRLAGDTPGYERARHWVRSTADVTTLDLPEQTTDQSQEGAESFVAEWTERWGAVAQPLLWSHAKYILLEEGTLPSW